MQKACSIDTVRRLQSKHGELLVMVTQRGCPPCPPFRTKVKRLTKGKKIMVVEVPAEDTRCDPLLDKLHVTETPTLLHIKGKSIRRIDDETMQKDLQGIIAKASLKRHKK